MAVIVPFRNEEHHLEALLSSLLRQNFPATEILLIDDHSTDKSLSVIESWGSAAGAEVWWPASAGQGRVPSYPGKVAVVRVLSLRNHLGGATTKAHKKTALAYGISETSADIILTTDADCILPPGLLQEVESMFTKDVQVVSGPVMNGPTNTFCDHFQALDLAAYQFLTAVCIQRDTPTLANGACFAFRKSAFEAVGGYSGVDHLPSGDDVLLLHKFRKIYPGSVFRWLTAGPVVETKPVGGWVALWRQRLRWAGKAGNYQAKELDFAQGLTFLCCLALLALIPLALHLRSVALMLLPWLAKGLVDYLNLKAFLGHYDQRGVLKYYLPTMLVYPFFLVGIGTATLFGFKAAWKGRTE